MEKNLKRIGRKRQQLSAHINVTPLVDVMLVLLVIFMITAPMLTVGVPVELPKTDAAQVQNNSQDEPLIVSVDANGKTYLQDTEIALDQIVSRLLTILKTNPKAKIYLRADQSLGYGDVMRVMGLMSKSGLDHVSLIAEMPEPTSPIKR